MNQTVVVATDGSAINNPNGPAGWAWFASEANWGAGAFPRASNQVAELFAVVAALRAIPREYAVHVRSDSQFTINVATKWMKGWKAKGWRKADGAPPENLSLVKELDTALTGRKVTFEWVRGHSGDPMNEIADRLCGAASKAQQAGTPIARGPGFTRFEAPTAEALRALAPKAPARKVAARPAGRSTAAATGRTAPVRRAVLRSANGQKTVLDRVPGWDDDAPYRVITPRVDDGRDKVQWCPSCDGPINLMTGECRCSFSGG